MKTLICLVYCAGNGNICDSHSGQEQCIMLKLILSNKDIIRYSDLNDEEFYFSGIKFLISQAIGKPHCLCLFRNSGFFHYIIPPSLESFFGVCMYDLCCCQVQISVSKKVKKCAQKTYLLSQSSNLNVAPIIVSHILLMRTLSYGRISFQRRLRSAVRLGSHMSDYYSVNAKKW